MNPSLLIVDLAWDGPVCSLTVSGDLDVTTAARFRALTTPALVLQPGRLVLSLAGLHCLDCAGARMLAGAVMSAACPVVVRSLGPLAARLLSLLDLILADLPAPQQSDLPVELGPQPPGLRRVPEPGRHIPVGGT
ncbi:MAG TPA: STAS domain-containing protein [Streptosporangiaceae bacterium]|jgi:anti-anti-sigma factor